MSMTEDDAIETSQARRDAALLLVRRDGVEPIEVWRTRSAGRINGLVWEDTVRSTDMFRPYPMPASVTSPIDIAPPEDLVQGIPTHVKAKKTPVGSRNAKGHWPGSVDMACAYQLFLIGMDPVHTHHRLVIGLYEVEKHTIRGEDVEVHCYHTVIEIIQSPTTFAAYRGSISVEAMRQLREDTHAFTDGFPITTDEVLRARDLFHPITGAWRDEGLMGLARISNKIDANQVRPQAQISLADLHRQLATEPDYAGRVVQANWIEHTTDFHGLPLPYRTTAKERVFVRPKDPYQKPRRPRIKVKPASTVPAIPVDPDARYLAAHIDRRDHDLPDGRFATIPVGDEGIVKAIRGDEAFRKRVSRACLDAGGARWIARGRLWVLPRENAIQAWKTLMRAAAPPNAGPAPLPKPDPTVMTTVKNRQDLYEVVSASGVIVRLLRLPHTNWVLRPDDGRGTPDPAETNRRSAAIIRAVCDRHGVGEWNGARQNMLIRQDPPDLIQRIAKAIADHDDRT